MNALTHVRFVRCFQSRSDAAGERVFDRAICNQRSTIVDANRANASVKCRESKRDGRRELVTISTRSPLATSHVSPSLFPSFSLRALLRSLETSAVDLYHYYDCPTIRACMPCTRPCATRTLTARYRKTLEDSFDVSSSDPLTIYARPNERPRTHLPLPSGSIPRDPRFLDLPRFSQKKQQGGKEDREFFSLSLIDSTCTHNPPISSLLVVAYRVHRKQRKL